MDKEKAITLLGSISKITTTVDGGWKLTFDVPQSELSKVMQLSCLRDMVLALAVVPDELEDPIRSLNL